MVRISRFLHGTTAIVPSMVRILIVEDDPRVGAVLEQGLSEEGFRVDRAYDGDQAIARALHGDYNLVLLDYMLPGKSGPEVAQALRQAGRQTPILMVTARDAPENLRYARECGVNEVCGKPFHFGELLDRIQSLIGDAGTP
jgi:two-component system, OmpR family, copper resistance phosphate regulon response regulator CusR